MRPAAQVSACECVCARAPPDGSRTPAAICDRVTAARPRSSPVYTRPYVLVRARPRGVAVLRPSFGCAFTRETALVVFRHSRTGKLGVSMLQKYYAMYIFSTTYLKTKIIIHNGTIIRYNINLFKLDFFCFCLFAYLTFKEMENVSLNTQVY